MARKKLEHVSLQQTHVNLLSYLLRTPCPRGYSFLFLFLFLFLSPIYAFHFRSLFYIYRDLSLDTHSIFSLLLGGGLYLYLSRSPLPTPTPLYSISHSSSFYTFLFPDDLLVLRHQASSAYFPWTIIRSCSLL